MSSGIDWEQFRGMAMDVGAGVVASSLAPQLGSDRNDLARGRTDMRRLTVIQKADIPFLIYAMIRGKKSRVWKDVYDENLNLNVSIGGRGRRDIIHMEQASKGGMVNLGGEIEKPGLFTRIFDRDWKQKQLEQRGEA